MPIYYFFFLRGLRIAQPSSEKSGSSPLKPRRGLFIKSRQFSFF